MQHTLTQPFHLLAYPLGSLLSQVGATAIPVGTAVIPSLPTLKLLQCKKPAVWRKSGMEGESGPPEIGC